MKEFQSTVFLFIIGFGFVSFFWACQWFTPIDPPVIVPSSTTTHTTDPTSADAIPDLVPNPFSISEDYRHSSPFYTLSDFTISNQSSAECYIRDVAVYFYLSKTDQLEAYPDFVNANFDTDLENDIYFFGYSYLSGPYMDRGNLILDPNRGNSVHLDPLSDEFPFTVFVNRYGFPNGRYWMYAWVNMNQRLEEVDSQAYNNNFIQSENRIEIIGSGNDPEDKWVIETTDADHSTDTFLMVFVNKKETGAGSTSEVQYTSIATQGGYGRVPCGLNGIGEEDIANRSIHSIEDWMGPNMDQPGLLNERKGWIHQYLINTFSNYKHVYFTPKTKDYPYDPQFITVNDDNPWDLTVSDITTEGGPVPNAKVTRWFPNQSIIHIRTQLSPFGEKTPGAYGMIAYKEINSETVPAYPGNCSGCSNQEYSTLYNVGTNHCNLSNWDSDDQMGRGALKLFQDQWVQSEFTSESELHWYYITIP